MKLFYSIGTTPQVHKTDKSGKKKKKIWAWGEKLRIDNPPESRVLRRELVIKQSIKVIDKWMKLNLIG